MRPDSIYNTYLEQYDLYIMEKKREYNIGSLPVSLKGALDSLGSDSKFLEEVFTTDFLEAYSELKYKEYTAFAQTPTAWEVSMYADA